MGRRPELDLLVNIKAWEALPKEYQAILEAACAEANVWMMAKYDALNPPALKRLVANGVAAAAVLRTTIMAACDKAADEVYAEIAAKSAKFKKIYDAVEEIPRRAGPVVLDRGEAATTTS